MTSSRWASRFPDVQSAKFPTGIPVSTFTWTGGGTITIFVNPITYLGCTATGGTGSGATFSVTRSAGTPAPVAAPVTAVSVTAGGSGYTIGDVLTISGTQIGGTSPANDVTVTVTG